MKLDQNILNEFKDVTQKDIAVFLSNVNLFLKTDRPSIVAYYNGSSTNINSSSFQKFEALQKQLNTFFEAYQLHSNVFNNSRWWDLLEILEQIDNTFSSLKNIHRWSRSSITKFGYDPNMQINYTLSENQTLERVSQDILLQNDPNNDWYKIAIANDLTEEEYTSLGGTEIQLSYPRINKGLKLKSVVDVIIGQKVYGIDLHKKIQFIEDSDGFTDLLALNHKDTVFQSVEILATLKKNNNPDFPNEGLQSSVVVGGNRALLNFPVIIRQLKQTFSTDDTLKNFMVKNIAYEQDNLLISYEVETRLNEAYDGKTIL